MRRLRLRASGSPRGLILVYHAVADRTGDPSSQLVPPHAAALLDAHLRHLRRHYELVTAADLLPAVQACGRGDRPPVAVTFDDDLPSHISHAAPVLERHGVQATFFLTGAGLDGPVTFWWERLQRAFDAGLSPADRERLAAAIGVEPGALAGPGGIRRASRAVQTLGDEPKDLIAELAGPDTPHFGLQERDIRRLQDAGQGIGFHTLRHERLPLLDDEALERAMTDGRDRLERIAGPLTEIAYPHGRGDRRVAQAAADAGFSRGFTTEWQPVRPEDDPHLLGRLEPPFEPERFAHTVAATLGQRQ